MGLFREYILTRRANHWHDGKLTQFARRTKPGSGDDRRRAQLRARHRGPNLGAHAIFKGERMLHRSPRGADVPDRRLKRPTLWRVIDLD
jgi:hypothetical protein